MRRAALCFRDESLCCVLWRRQGLCDHMAEGEGANGHTPLTWSPWIRAVAYVAILTTPQWACFNTTAVGKLYINSPLCIHSVICPVIKFFYYRDASCSHAVSPPLADTSIRLISNTPCPHYVSPQFAVGKPSKNRAQSSLTADAARLLWEGTHYSL